MESNCTFVTYRETNSFSNLANDYVENKPSLRDFFAFTPDLDGIGAAIQRRKSYNTDRLLLVEVLNKQYASLTKFELVEANLRLLGDENTFTICTAHQPNLLTGYLYFFYKIIHAIKMAESLKEHFPENNFVPVYYMGSEDNDLDELGQFNYNNEFYKWDADDQTGAVGKMNTESLKPLLQKLISKLGPPGKNFDELIALISDSYLKHKTITSATQYLVHQLFGRYGLIILNPDDAQLKNQFKHIIKDDLFNHSALPIVKSQSSRLEQEYKVQAFPRQINHFYLKDNIRERIEIEGSFWKVLNTNIQFTQEEMEKEIDNFPERFSPNVVLRGLFQELILPDVCFIGGGSELAYWMQLKPLFQHYNIFYPTIFLRQSAQILSLKAVQLIEKLDLRLVQIFESKEELLKTMIIKENGESWSVASELDTLKTLFQKLRMKAISVDPTLEKASAATEAKIEKQLQIFEQKMYRAEKRKHTVYQSRINALKEEIFPNGGLQERVENFMPYFLEYGFEIFDVIKEQIDPFDNKFLIINATSEV